MQQFVIEGGVPLRGEITPQGNKNEALPVLCAALLSPFPVTISNIPDIEDVRNLLQIIEYLGGKITRPDPSTVTIHVPEIKTTELPGHLTASIRGSVTLLGPMLGRMKEAYLPKPGGDKIGRRRVDTHLLALEALGAKISVDKTGYRVTASHLKGAGILLDEASVTGTENALMVAAVAEGDTILENAASEPHVQGLCQLLISMGVKIDGVGSNVLHIHGVGSWENLKGTSHVIGPDYLEVGSFISMGALTGGEITIQGVNPNDLRMIKLVYSRLGIEFSYKDPASRKTDLYLRSSQKMQIRTDVHGEIPKIDDAPWPAFPADMLSVALVTAVRCSGTVLFHEKLFESRLYFTDKLISMGAKIVLCDPHRAVVIGPSPLHSANLTSPDIRAGMALVIAALAAEGTSHIQNIIQIDRGYQNIDHRLRALGARIERTIIE